MPQPNVQPSLEVERLPASQNQELPTIADSSYELFLDKNNYYHLLLSHKIFNQYKSEKDVEPLPPAEEAIAQYEKLYNLSYSNEIEQILKIGNFDQHLKEELFLINELSLINLDRAIIVLEEKLNIIIVRLNSGDNTARLRFESLLLKYVNLIETNNFSAFDKQQALLQSITSLEITELFYQYWEPLPFTESSPIGPADVPAWTEDGNQPPDNEYVNPSETLIEEPNNNDDEPESPIYPTESEVETSDITMGTNESFQPGP